MHCDEHGTIDYCPECLKEKDNEKELVMFLCPSFSKAGLMCIFSSMRDLDSKKGLRCKSKACEIRIPLEE